MAQWNSKDAIQSALAQYQQQHAEAVRLLTEVQTQALKLEGAIASLEQLLVNAKDEEAQPTDEDEN